MRRPSSKNPRRTLRHVRRHGLAGRSDARSLLAAVGALELRQPAGEVVERVHPDPVARGCGPAGASVEADEPGRGQPLEVSADDGRCQLQVAGDLGLGGRARGEAADDPQADRIGQGLQGGEQVVVHGSHRTIAVVLPDGRRLGAHLPVTGGMVKAVDRASAIGATALQIWIDNPTAWRRRAEPPAELPAFRSRLAEPDIGPVAVHASYLVNLAGPDPDFRERSIALLASDLRAAPAFGARFVNVHVGSHRDTTVAAGTARLADAIVTVLAEVDDGPDAAILVLENSAGAGFGLGTDVSELAAIAEAVAARGVSDRRVAFCIDTAHAWAAGIDLGTVDGVDAFVAGFGSQIGLARLPMIHLNNSKADRGSRLDRHERLGAGRIGQPGLARILTHPALAATAYYLETPGMEDGYDAVNVGRAYDLAAGRPLATLAPEAMALQGSRATAKAKAKARASAKAAEAAKAATSKAKTKATSKPKIKPKPKPKVKPKPKPKA